MILKWEKDLDRHSPKSINHGHKRRGIMLNIIIEQGSANRKPHDMLFLTH